MGGNEPKVLRVTKGRIKAGMEAEAFALVREIVENSPRPDGLEAFEFGRKGVDGRLEIIAFTTWSNHAAMVETMGDASAKPTFSPRLEAYVETTTVDWFELVPGSWHGFADLDPAGPPEDPAIDQDTKTDMSAVGDDGQVFGG